MRPFPRLKSLNAGALFAPSVALYALSPPVSSTQRRFSCPQAADTTARLLPWLASLLNRTSSANPLDPYARSGAVNPTTPVARAVAVGDGTAEYVLQLGRHGRTPLILSGDANKE